MRGLLFNLASLQPSNADFSSMLMSLKLAPLYSKLMLTPTPTNKATATAHDLQHPYICFHQRIWKLKSGRSRLLLAFCAPAGSTMTHAAAELGLGLKEELPSLDLRLVGSGQVGAWSL